MQAAGRIHVGTSGWSYAHWKGAFYPRDSAQGAWLPFYAQHFKTVEINASFYRLPSAETLARWRDEVPAHFFFSAKASRYITHVKKLRDPQVTVPKFIDRINVLGEKLGPTLFQLPPNWRFNEARLAAFLQRLDPRHRYAIEFRDPSWFDRRACRLLARHEVAFCIHDLDGRQSPAEITTDFVYVRLHGPDGPYRGRYDVPSLSGWAASLAKWAANGRAVYCYFDNDEMGHAVENAMTLQQLLQQTRAEF